MARIRYIKPEFWEDTDIAELSLPARLLYIGLWNFMDRRGVIEADVRLVKKNVFPYDDEITGKKITAFLAELVDEGFLSAVEHGGKRYYYCPTFQKHQNFHPSERNKYEIPDSVLQASYQQLTSQLLASFNNLTSTTGTGTGTGTGTAEVGPTSPAPSSGDIHPLLKNELTNWLLEKVQRIAQDTWVKTYPSDWIREELVKSVNWIRSNPRRAPRSDFVRFLNSWLARAWEKHRKTLSTKPQAEILRFETKRGET